MLFILILIINYYYLFYSFFVSIQVRRHQSPIFLSPPPTIRNQIGFLDFFPYKSFFFCFGHVLFMSKHLHE